MPTWFIHDKEKAAFVTERITVVLAIPYTTTVGVETIIHILAHITGKLVSIFPVTPHKVAFFFNLNSGSNLD